MLEIQCQAGIGRTSAMYEALERSVLGKGAVGSMGIERETRKSYLPASLSRLTTQKDTRLALCSVTCAMPRHPSTSFPLV